MKVGKIIDEIKRSVQSRNRKALQIALADLDDCQLLESTIEPKIFDVYVWLLSDESAISAPGVDKIFVNFTGDIQKYSREQIYKIILAIDASRISYKSQALRMAAADFVARNGEVGEAFGVLEKWAGASDDISRQMARAGFDILLAGSRICDIETRKKAEMLRDNLMRG
ncbi:hypothetical protein [Burkholderia lata]|uniref:hypothetical protein n=1 Tax=Burkholderia lata (strain ATCC 17760 / DSM 23089 / LMG 22485 / NCIMB 9086 / R18194 / 383) TaxID=482957 RepID=UPI0012FE5DE6|nr:hypothetical protein [Burkholderia lata]